MEIVAIESDDSSDNDLIAGETVIFNYGNYVIDAHQIENNSIVSMVTFPDTIIGLTSSHDYRYFFVISLVIQYITVYSTLGLLVEVLRRR